MKTNNTVIFSMRKCVISAGIWMSLVCFLGLRQAIAQQHPPREYNNPNEQVTFDRTTSFKRALDVLNNFAQKYVGKSIIDRTQTQGNLGITVPPMQWRDALNLILRARYLKLVGHKNYYEVVKAETHGEGEVPVASRPDTTLTTHSKEVRINAIFFEGNRSALQEVGVDWSTLTNNVPGNVGSYVNNSGSGGGGGSGGGSGGSGGGSGSGNGQLPSQFNGPFVSVNAKGAQSVSQNVFNSLINFGQVFGTGISVQALFSAFQADNLGKILASPSVRVLNGQKGHIQVGQDFSIAQRDFAGNTTQKFFSVGTILNVTPHVIEREDTTFIHLNIEAEKSSAQPDPVSTVINKQNAKTQALLLNHEATVIAGLYRTESTKVRRGVPILKDLPAWFFGLRYLFGYNSTTNKTRELVILIQASIVPGIPQRMNKRLPGEFEKLKRERQRMENNIRRYHKLINDKKSTKDSTDAFHHHEPNMEHPPSIKKERMIREQPLNDETLQDSSLRHDHSISKDNHQYNYYVIGGSFNSKKNAAKVKQRFSREGFKPEILFNKENGLYMVAYKGFNTQNTALALLRRLKEQGQQGAWLYTNQ